MMAARVTTISANSRNQEPPPGFFTVSNTYPGRSFPLETACIAKVGVSLQGLWGGFLLPKNRPSVQ
jgi:hypothetical protein